MLLTFLLLRLFLDPVEHGGGVLVEAAVLAAADAVADDAELQVLLRLALVRTDKGATCKKKCS